MQTLHLITFCLIAVFVEDSFGVVSLNVDSETSRSIYADWSVENGHSVTGYILRYKPVISDEFEEGNKRILFEEGSDVSFINSNSATRHSSFYKRLN